MTAHPEHQNLMKAHILLIEDEPALRSLFQMILESARYRVTLAGHGREAMALLAQHTFDLVITDVLMPEQDGIETIVEVRRRWPDLPVLAMTGGGQIGADLYLRLAKTLGASRLLPKPFSSEELLHAVAALLASSPRG